MKETSKAQRRRTIEHVEGVFPWMDIFKGRILDIGAGDDPLPSAEPFDQEQGDANTINKYYPDNCFDVIHSSQSLEHMHNPVDAFAGWLKILKPGGFAVVTVPDLGLFEGFIYPSRFNGDHKTSWSLCYRRSPFPKHVYVPDFLEGFSPIAETKLVRIVDTNYDYTVMTSRDQSFQEFDNVEMWVEFVMMKK